MWNQVGQPDRRGWLTGRSSVRSTLMALGLMTMGSLWSMAQAATGTSDVTAPGDPVTPIKNSNQVAAVNSDFPSAEGPTNSIDNVASTKYLNFRKANTGIVVTPRKGATIVTGLRLTTANDAPERDPLTYELQGANDFNASAPNPSTATWTTIASGSTGLDTDPGRGAVGGTVSFANSTAYSSYKLIFPTLRNLGSAAAMQVGEIELFGAVPDVPQPGPNYEVNSTNDNNDGACTTGHCSLREAINAANANADANIITFDGTTFGSAQTINLASGLTINNPVTITGTGARLLTVQSGSFTIRSGTVKISGMTISGGLGLANSGGDVTLDGVTVSGTSGFSNAAVDNESGTMSILNSTISNNACLGLIAQGLTSVSNTTISGNNDLGNDSGGVYVDGTLNLDSVTVTNNRPRGINNQGGTVNIRNTIVAGNGTTGSSGGTPADISGAFVSQGNNLIGTTAGGTGFTQLSDKTNVAANLGALADNGGPTDTHALLTNSPALDAGDTALTTDQRGKPRPAGSADDIGSVEVDPTQNGPIFIVNSTADTDDGVCTESNCTLREALNAANSKPNGAQPDEITFSSLFNSVQLIQLASLTPEINDAVKITGPGANLLEVRGGNLIPFQVNSVNSDFSGLTISNSNKGLLAYASPLTNVTNCVFNGNTTGFDHYGGGTAIVTNCTFNNPGGGGSTSISNAAGSTVTVTNCTLNGLATYGINNSGSATVTNCTIGGFSRGIKTDNTNITLKNTISVGNFGVDIEGTVNAASNNNLIGDGSGGLTNGTNGNIVGTSASKINPLLGALADNGGPTKTRALLPGSPAINAASNADAPAADQRGIARPQQTTADIGAFESRGFTLAVSGGNNQNADNTAKFANPLSVTVSSANNEPVTGGTVTFTAPGNGASATFGTNPATIISNGSASTTATANNTAGSYIVTASATGGAPVNFNLTNNVPSLVVTTSADEDNGTSNAAFGTGTSLREAINYANSKANGAQADEITFSSLFNTAQTIQLSSTLPNISDDVKIIGPGAKLLTVRGTGSNTCFSVNSAKSATISALTITNCGTGIFNGGTLTATECAFTGNSGFNIHNFRGPSVTVTNCTISGGSSGIFVQGGNATVTNCTISGTGTGIRPSVIDGGNATITNCTISGNGIGVDNGSGSMLLKNSIVAGSSNRDSSGFFNSASSYNLIGDGTSSLTNGTNGNIVGTNTNKINPLLGALADNGGPTQTMALLPGSPATNAANNANAPATDQRGIARPQQTIADIGAFESRGFTVTISGGNNQSTTVNTAFANPLAVTVSSAFAEPVDGGKITFTVSASGASATLGANPATISGGAASTTATANGTTGTYTVTASANGATPASVRFSLTNKATSPTNTAPIANAQSVTTNQGVAKAITLTGSDVDNDPLTYAIATGPAHGTLTGNGANRTYTPNASFAGNDSFTFVANDGTVDSAPATVSITVTEAPSLIVTTSQDITANDGFTSLREAIAYANRKVGADTILFAIPTPRGAGVQTIQLASALPTLSGSGAATTIDGYSQAGASANTLAVGSNAVILIEVRGNGVAAFDGLTIDAANCVVKGLSIGNCRYGINLESSEAHDTVISGNFIGLAANGSAASANDYGISIDHAANVTVGGATPAARNVIGANNAEGIVTTGDNGTISGNYIGTNAAASSARPNRSGVLISVGAGNTLSGNLISGNTQNGVAIYGSGASSAPNNIVRGNTIGLSSGGSALGNGIGVSILDASASIIGGVGGGQANIISGNSGKGVIVRGNLAAGSSVRGNAIYANGGLGIDLNDDGVSANDLGDGDSGPNGLQNFPVITALSSNGGGGIATNSIGGSSSISGTLNSTPNQSFSIDLYDNAAADASGYGQGQTYLGTTTANTDNNGNATFSATLNGVSLANGRVISATATDASGNSSEFSLARTFDSNNAPVASNGPANVDEDDSVQITLVASDADNNALTYSIVSNPAHGTLGAVVGNKVTYTPAANYNGSDSFTFKANDGKADSNVATVSITINIVSDAPVAVDDSYIAQAGKTLTVDAPGVLGNDTNVDDDIVTVGSYTQPANGSVTLNTDGSFVYTPDLGFHGTDSFTYRSTDSHLPSNAATVTIVVQLVQVSSFSPAGGAPGTEVTVNGQNFVGVDDVQLNGQSTAFTVISSRKLTFIVPAGATTGKISVLAGVDNVSSAKEFVVAPRNITFTPSSGVAADVITISGENLGDVRTTVKFSGATAPVNARVEMRSATTMTVVVPNTAVTGPISVSNIGGSASSASSFVVNPSISSFTPSAGGFKTLVKVNGKGLGGATAVLLNGVNVGSFTQVSATQVSFSVPAGATTGKITVMTPSGMAVSSQNFSVYPK